MIKLYGRAYVGHERDGDGMYHSVPRKYADLRFRCYADMLRHAATLVRYGQAGTPASVYLGSLRDPNGHRRCRVFEQVVLPREDWERLVKLQSRYLAYLHYWREVLPEWREVRRIPWADNSVSVAEVDRWGNRRERQLTSPSGDACF